MPFFSSFNNSIINKKIKKIKEKKRLAVVLFVFFLFVLLISVFVFTKDNVVNVPSISNKNEDIYYFNSEQEEKKSLEYSPYGNLSLILKIYLFISRVFANIAIIFFVIVIMTFTILKDEDKALDSRHWFIIIISILGIVVCLIKNAKIGFC